MGDGQLRESMQAKTYKPPFPYFGGKSRVAHIVWKALGNVKNYVEPFFGSGAVLFLRPHPPGIETVNDADGLLSNFWRSVQKDPETVAEHADWPVNECDLHARHLWLVGQKDRITDKLMGDPDFYDPRAAGWWVWGISCWIGGGWCNRKGGWVSRDGKLIKDDNGGGVARQAPHLGDAGNGVHRKADGTRADRRAMLVDYMRSLSDRLRAVRVCCGDWSRVCTRAITYKHGLTGVFLDPPYSTKVGRSEGVYAEEHEVSSDVRQWAIENGRNPMMRIVLSGYEGEHEMPSNWRVYAWRAHGGYSNLGNGMGRKNKVRERLWFSPHCLRAKSPELFEGG